MNMKNVILKFIIASLILISCNKDLDIIPENILTETQIVQSQTLTFGLLTDSYFKTYKAERGLPYYNGADIATGIDSSLAIFFQPLWNGTANSITGQIIEYWNSHFDAINEANIIINRTPTEANYDTALKSQYIAQAKFIRAFNYFALLRYFGNGALTDNLSGDGLPLQKNNFTGYSSSKNIKRSSCLETYNFILEDLESAGAALKSTTNTGDVLFRGFGQKLACYALASRVALYAGNYQKVIEYANLCFSNLGSNYRLNSSPYNVFPVTTAISRIPIDQEIIFSFPVSYFNFGDLGQPDAFYYNKNATLWPASSFINSYNVNDIRFTRMLVTGNPKFNLNRRCPSKFSNPNGIDNLPIIRLAEVYLNHAEALVKLNRTVDAAAINSLNLIRQRAFTAPNIPAPYQVSNFATYQALLTAILQERRWELAFEGHDRFDRIRNNLPLNPLLDADKRKYVWPIPLREIQLTNGLITQNPSY